MYMTTTDLSAELAAAASADLPVRRMVREHLGVRDDLLDDVPVFSTRFTPWRAISVQASLEALLSQAESVVRGVPMAGFAYPDFAELLITPGLELGPIDYVSKDTGPDSTLACIRSGVVCTSWADSPVALWIHPITEGFGTVSGIGVSVKSTSVEAAHGFLAALRDGLTVHDPYKGNSLKLHIRAGNIENITFEPRPFVSRDEVIMRPGLLDDIDAHAISVGQNAAKLRAAGRHLKRGLLLYGPPGTGKTHTIRYLASQLPDATLFVLTGGAMGTVKIVASLLEQMAPAIIVLDDVDLIAEDRDNAGNAGSTLFNLLDAMDGMSEDVDVLFICTTNRVESLEKAIAARPGRIDQAIEVAVPDRECRARLITLYGEGLDLRLTDLDTVLDRTAGVTASFIKELLRRASLLALAGTSPDGALTVTDEHVRGALDILLDPSLPLTKSLLGIHESADTTELERTEVRGAGEAWSGV